VSRRRERSTKTAAGPGPSYAIRTPQRGGNRPLAWGVRSRHISAGAGTRAWPRSFPRKTRPPTVFNAGDVSALCHNRARVDFYQSVLLTARYQGTQCSLWRRLRHARQSATPVRHDSSATEYHNAYAVDPTVYAATYTSSTGASPMGQVKTPSVRESTGR
jgi:hypothetical protein